MACIAALDKPEPVLPHLGKAVPAVDQPLQQVRVCFRLQEPQVLDDRLVQRPILCLVAVEQQEWVNEERQVRDDRDIEGTVLVQHVGTDVEAVAEVNPGGVWGPSTGRYAGHFFTLARPWVGCP